MSSFTFEVGDHVRFASGWDGLPRAMFVVVCRYRADDGQLGYGLRKSEGGARRFGLERELEFADAAMEPLSQTADAFHSPSEA